MNWMFIAIFFIALLLNIWAIQQNQKILVVLTKPLLMVCLLLFYLLQSGHVDWFVVIALAAGLAGDVFLMLPDKRFFFVAGLFSFLAGHVSYISAFLRSAGDFSGLPFWVIPAVFAYIAAGVAVYRILEPDAGNLKPQVALYMATIVCMGIATLTSLKYMGNPRFLLAIAGGILFIVSDTCLAVAKFKKVQGKSGIVMLTYGLAQLCLTLWFTLGG